MSPPPAAPPSLLEPGWAQSPPSSQHLRTLRLPEPLGTRGEQLSTGAGNALKEIFLKKKKMCWFQVTSGCFWIAGRGSFSPSPKSVTQKSQPGSVQATDLYFPVFHAAGLAQGNRQACPGKCGWERVSHLTCTALAPALPVDLLSPELGDAIVPQPRGTCCSFSFPLFPSLHL